MPNATTITVSVLDIPELRALLDEALDAECRHVGEPYAGHDDASCYDECGACRVRAVAHAIVARQEAPNAG